MTNDFDNENNEEFGEAGAPEPGKDKGATGNLVEAWRTRPLFKFVVLVIAVFAIGAAAVNFFGGSNKGTETARLGRPPSLKEAPGGVVSPYMRQQTELANNERAQQALESGGSAIPTPMGQTTDVGNFGAAGKKEDPLNELRAETEQLKKQIQQQQQVQQAQIQRQQIQAAQAPQQRQADQQYDNQLSEEMQRQLQQLMTNWTPPSIKSVTVSKVEPGQENGTRGPGGAQVTPVSAPANTANAQKVVITAGTVSYAQLLTEANSDVPGPILAQIVSGPLTGARAVGSFQVSVGYKKYLVLSFRIANKSGKDYAINAVALDPDTTLGGMATEVDERYFTRVILPAAAGFLQGMGQSLAQGNATVTTNGSTSITQLASNGSKQGIYNGLGQASQTLSSFFQQQANLTQPLVRVAAGTPIGIFFVTSVVEPTTAPNASQEAFALASPSPAGIGYAQGVAAGTPGGGYPGNAIYGYGLTPQTVNSVPYPYYSMPGYAYARSSPYSSFSSPYGGASYGVVPGVTPLQ